jgi:hypothetical protein
MDTDKLWSRAQTDHGRAYGQDAVVVTDWKRAWTSHGRECGLDITTVSRPDIGANISRLNRDHFADNRALKIQGVRRPPCNPHKLCGHSRIHLRTGHYTNSGMFRHRAETFSEISIALTGRSCTRSETKQVGSGMNGRRRSGAWGRNGR